MFMVVPIVAKIELSGWPALKKRELNNLRKEAYRQLGHLWLREFLPRHFKAGAAERYGYEPRTSKYLKRKLAQEGHTVPLVFSGRYRRIIQGPAAQRVIPTNKGVTVKLDHRAAHRIVHRKVHDDIVRVTPGERQELAQAFVRYMTQLLNAVQARRTVRIAS